MGEAVITNLDLIRCLEEAKEGSRELDEAIGKTQGYKVGVDIGLSPHYTTSLDAALSLVPEGWPEGRISWPGRDSGYLKANARAEIHHALSSGGGPREIGFGATLALALVIAILKAMEAEGG